MGWLRKTPILSLLFAVAIVAAPFLLADAPAQEGAQFESTRDEARAYLTRNPRLELDVLGELILGPAWVEETRQAAAPTDGQLDVRLPPRLLARSQARLDELLSQAYEARMESDPAWRLGVLDAQSPPQNYFAHVFVQGTSRGEMAGIALCVLVLLIAGIPLERSWGSAIFGAFAVASILVVAQAYRLLDASSGVPWHGGAGLAGAILGAYFIRGLGGHFVVPGWVLLPAWLGVECFTVRGFWIDDFSTVPWATLFGAIGFGALTAGVLRVLNVEKSLDERAAQRKPSGPNPIVVRAARLRSDGDPYQAFDLIQAAWREDPKDTEVREIFFSIAVEVGQPEVAANAIVPSIRSALKQGDVQRALDYWFPLASKECVVDLEPTAFVRLGEALLDASHPEEALFSLRGALDAGVSSSHATRIVNIARDLDEGLARKAAAIALADPGLDPKSRSELEDIAIEPEPAQDPEATSPISTPAAEPSRSQLDRRVQAEHQTVETTAFPLESDLDLEPNAADLSEDPDTDFTGDLAADSAPASEAVEESLHAGALSQERLAAEVGDSDAANAEADFDAVQDSGDVLSHWNDPTALDADAIEGRAGELSQEEAGETMLDVGDLETPDMGFDFGLRADAPDLVDPRDDETDTDLTPMLDATDELTSPMSVSQASRAGGETSTGIFDERTQIASALPGAAMPAAAPASRPAETPTQEEIAFGGAEEQATSVLQLRSLKALEAVPVEAGDGWLEVEVDDRGKSRLPFARIQAIAIAAVSGLGARPVLILDFLLNWRGEADEPMKLIRLRSDRFDPHEYAQGANPLAALTAWVAELESQSGATCLPNRDVLSGQYARFESLADYEREVLMASSLVA